jgi:hypothetical protein
MIRGKILNYCYRHSQIHEGICKQRCVEQLDKVDITNNDSNKEIRANDRIGKIRALREDTKHLPVRSSRPAQGPADDRGVETEERIGAR